MPDIATTPAPHLYTEIYEAPAPWRMLNGAPLTVQQLNVIIAMAYELGTFGEGDPPPFNPAYGKARAAFRTTHRLEHGLWIKN